MSPLDIHSTRRRLLALGGTATAAALLPASADARARATTAVKQHGKLPVAAIEQALELTGSVSSGVLSFGVDRTDIGKVKSSIGVTFPPSFEIGGDLTFQPLGPHRAFFNGDLALKAHELNPVVDAIQSHGLVFQAMHQHYFGLDPMVWFVHFRGTGEPVALARAVRAVLGATSTPLHQKPPAHPHTPLPHHQLAKLLHGSAEISDDGVVTVTVSRKDKIVVDGVEVSPEANVSTNISFLPLDKSGSMAVAAPDFSMRAHEVQRVCRTMRAAGFEIGCLYNQETGEHPQLYFAHMLAQGAPLDLAAKIRRGLDLTKSD
jgi:Domain of Unknown Function (DUF1259)